MQKYSTQQSFSRHETKQMFTSSTTRATCMIRFKNVNIRKLLDRRGSFPVMTPPSENTHFM